MPTDKITKEERQVLGRRLGENSVFLELFAIFVAVSLARLLLEGNAEIPLHAVLGYLTIRGLYNEWCIVRGVNKILDEDEE